MDLQETTIKLLKEANDVIIENNIVEVDLTRLIKEALKSLQIDTDVISTLVSISDNKAKLSLEGNSSNIIVFKEKLGIEDDQSNELITNAPINKIKQGIYNYLKKHIKEQFKLTFSDIDDMDPEVVYLTLILNIDTVPYPYYLSVNLYDDNTMTTRVTLEGNRDNDEYWSSLHFTNFDDMLAYIEKIKQYYNSSLKEG